ncbi:transcriptional regulator, Crp/Fnr family [Geosporobacter subterraneus DSM 17957]|uniref:Transcriptional regulator, Crp/Fnr family n=1 Tax=Geosporobacter subterraneus DSM 17957 TaxID=1121919 RepID=A0A1M6JG82_9FIRM|nr:Crp/Fnr family transcriptional regulator [Geosporobacter subterraneus]SHJ45684.1 transcriptional regulator, Crp/Fnr family [Geosporobacter subterraneus DSM 17957]
MVKNIELIKHVPLFSQLDQESLEKISSITQEKRYRKGAIIFMEGDKGEALYFIKSGKVKISKLSNDGRELILNIYGSGDVFAEVTLFNNVMYPATAEVMEDAVVGVIMNGDLEELVRQNADLALQIIKILNKRLYMSQMKLKQMALSDTYVRTAQILVKLADDHGVEKNGAIDLKLDLSRQELANMIGTARETVSRALSQFKKEGSIEISGKKIIIKNMEKLKSWLQS